MTGRLGSAAVRASRRFDRVMDPLHLRAEGSLEDKWDLLGGPSRLDVWEMGHLVLATLMGAVLYTVAAVLGLTAATIGLALSWHAGTELEPWMLAIPAVVLLLELRPVYRSERDLAQRYAAWRAARLRREDAAGGDGPGARDGRRRPSTGRLRPPPRGRDDDPRDQPRGVLGGVRC